MNKKQSGLLMPSKMNDKLCPQCKNRFDATQFEVGYGISVPSLHCKNCGFNLTDDSVLTTALSKLREMMKKEVKVIRIGEGLGIRFPNDVVKNYNLAFGEDMLLVPEADGIKIVPIV